MGFVFFYNMKKEIRVEVQIVYSSFIYRKDYERGDQNGI